MNRRTFLQSVGALAVIPAIPAIAKTPEPQPIRQWENIPAWIDFVHQMPTYGQKIAFCTYFDNHKSINIATGEVVHRVTNPRKGRYYHNEGTVLIKMAVSYSPTGFFRNGSGTCGKPSHIKCDICLYDMALYALRKETQKKIHRATWIDNNKEVVYPIPCCTILAPRHGDKISPYIGRDRSYWFPIDDYIPQHLPKLPKPLPLILDGEGNLIK